MRVDKMSKSHLYIGILEPSSIVQEGIESFLLKSQLSIKFFLIKDLEDVNFINRSEEALIIVINPTQIQNRIKLFKKLKADNPHIRWIGLVYSVFENELLGHFDDVISLYESRESILRKIIKKQQNNGAKNNSNHNSDELTDREIDVLKELIRGKSNKKIAELLNISVHTVMSHRKNIIQKTNIRSQAALTIYALTNNIISIENT